MLPDFDSVFEVPDFTKASFSFNVPQNSVLVVEVLFNPSVFGVVVCSYFTVH
jgi:hypothetical protein